MELVRTRILTGTCPHCGTRLTGQERGDPADDPRAVDWVLVKQWCYNGCLTMGDGPVIPIQPDETRTAPKDRTPTTYLIVRP
jgi:hypothetical protein